MPFCKYCGNEVDEDHIYCKKCGRKLGNNENTNVIKNDEIRSNQKIEGFKSKFSCKILDIKRKKPNFLLIGIILGVVILSVVVWAVFGQPEISLTHEADQLYDSGKFDEALIKYNESLEVNPEYTPAINGKFNALLSLGDEFYNSGKYSEALIKYNEALEVNPESATAITGKYNTLLSLGDEAKGTITCIYHYRAAGNLMPENIEPLIREGDEWEDLGNYVNAIGCYSDALVKEPDNNTIREKLYELCENNRPSTGTIAITWSDAHLDQFSESIFDTARDGITPSWLESKYFSVYQTNKITFDNTLGSSDCVVILKSSEDQASVFVRKGEKYTVYNVPHDTFYVYVTTGEYWNPDRNEFIENARYYKMEDDFIFLVSSGYYKSYELSLYPAIEGDVQLKYLSESSFPDVQKDQITLADFS